ncbi:NAD(P)/FAD-dependent oxidoreductase [Rhizobium sp. C4]|uniref:NAD(P)/FAD-dependent oxidoreductase n=1 Tax=Rhizobium sp. C4 TaxID=1349800 RepID=UPI001E50297A|nr:NAD(P)/FAD-dependent oxidoreductase [Rhizobium sp. C4]MCD2175963.1 NAD(P)/FAD-dependent oxidoreductase [Rhizobium sp. C4]
MHDTIIIGGSFAGLSAAMYLGRGRHDVVVLDTGMPRNRFSPQSHGFFTHDGSIPSVMLSTARTQLKPYSTVRLVDGEAVSATGARDGFSVMLAAGDVLKGRRLILASGVRDILPPINGLAERWGTSVLHCPYCHGYEYADHRLGVLYAGPASLHHARLIANWGPTTLFTNGVDVEQSHTLATHGIAVETAPIIALHGSDGRLSHVELAPARCARLDALYIAPAIEPRSQVSSALGCAMRETPAGSVLAVDDRMMTSVPGVHAAGDIAAFPSMVARAVADGSLAGAMVSQSLIFDT